MIHVTKCFSCGKRLERAYKSKTGKYFCNNKCQGKYLSKTKSDKIYHDYQCIYCEKKFKSYYNKKFCGIICYNKFINNIWKFKKISKKYKKIRWENGNGELYFLTTKNSNGIKIGYSRNAYKRASGMQSDNYENIIILAIIQGANRDDEKVIHNKFMKYRVHGEWYSSCDEILKYIDNL